MNITSKSGIIGLQPTASTWGTAIAPGASDLVYAKSLPLLIPADMSPDEAVGWPWHKYIDKTFENGQIELAMDARWSGRQWSLVAQCMGLDTKTGSGPYTHLLTLLEDISGSDLFSTMAYQFGPAAGELIGEFPAVKPTGFTFEGPVGPGYMQLTVRCIVDTMKLGGDATTTTTNIDNLTHISLNSLLPAIIPFGAMRFRINTASGDALASGDTIKPTSINFTFNRQMEPEKVARGAIANAYQSDEPIENGIPEATLTVGLPDFNALTYLENFQDETEKKAEMYFLLSGSYSHKIEFPSLKPYPPEATAQGSQRIPQTLNYTIQQALSNPSGMAFDLPRWTIIDDHATAYE